GAREVAKCQRQSIMLGQHQSRWGACSTPRKHRDGVRQRHSSNEPVRASLTQVSAHSWCAQPESRASKVYDLDASRYQIAQGTRIRIHKYQVHLVAGVEEVLREIEEDSLRPTSMQTWQQKAQPASGGGSAGQITCDSVHGRAG